MNRTCQRYGVDLIAWQEGTLDGHGAARLRSHVALCGECRAWLDWLDSTEQRLETMGDRQAGRVPSPDLTDSVMRAIACIDAMSG